MIKKLIELLKKLVRTRLEKKIKEEIKPIKIVLDKAVIKHIKKYEIKKAAFVRPEIKKDKEPKPVINGVKRKLTRRYKKQNTGVDK